MARKKKERPDRDEFGRKDIPYATSERQMEFEGIKPLRGASSRSVEIRRKGIAAIAIIIVAFFTLAAFVGLSSSAKTSRLSSAVEENYSPAFKTRYESLGESVITSYFSHQTPTVNLLSGVQWTTNVTGGNNGNSSAASGSNNSGSGSGESAPVDVEGISLLEAYQTDFTGGDISKEDEALFKNPKNEVLRYSGVIDGRQYEFGVYFIIPDIDNYNQLPYLVSAPTILPMDKLVTANVEGSKPSGEKFAETEINEGTVDAINRWASAYAQNDGDTIKSLTGDGRSEATYSGVGGFTLEGTPEIEWAYQFEDAEDKEPRIVARITFTMSQTVSKKSSAGEDIAGSSSSSRFAPKQVMDILLGNFDEGVANILAWGAGGTWQTLFPRMNSVIPVVVSSNKDNPDEGVINTPSTTSETSLSPSSSGDQPSTGVPGAPTLTENDSSSSSSSSFVKPKTSSEKSSGKNKTSSKKSATKTSSKNDN